MTLPQPNGESEAIGIDRVEDEYGCTADGDGQRHGNAVHIVRDAGCRDGNDLTTGGILLDDAQHLVELFFLNADHERCISAMQEPARGGNVSNMELMVDECTGEHLLVVVLNDSK